METQLNYKKIEEIVKRIRRLCDGWSAVQLVDAALVIYAARHKITSDVVKVIGLTSLSDDEIAKLEEVFPAETSLYDIISLYEHLLPLKLKAEKGITFTPEYIATHIVKSVVGADSKLICDKRILDPSCGLGVFLLAALYYMKKKIGKKAWDILADNLFGVDIEESNINIARKVLCVAACELDSEGCTKKDLASINLKCRDSLSIDWRKEFGFQFEGIVGNPPYINPHDLPGGVKEFLKTNFSTTTLGTTNIYYAFIEHGMKFLAPTGALSYIIPNNFITITAAKALRAFMVANSYVARLIDFTDNMIFSPVRTYNAIITLNKQRNKLIEYARIASCSQSDIKKLLTSLRYSRISYSFLNDEHRWTLLSPAEQCNIRTIEGQLHQLKQFIKTGVATLRDCAYLVERTKSGKYVKTVNGRRYEIEPAIIRQIYKISEIDSSKPIVCSVRYIIFPYHLSRVGKHEIIHESIMEKKYPGAYACLKAQRGLLDQRDKGKPNSVAWYAYGRTQGINLYGQKLIYPTFSKYPKFALLEDKGALFCNGYAMFANDVFPIDILQKIVNSCIMKYYVEKTSYPIEGGFMCYQKKYIERFSVPPLTMEQMEYIRAEKNPYRIDSFLLRLYGLPRTLLHE